jgi:hypothetical protein
MCNSTAKFILTRAKGWENDGMESLILPIITLSPPHHDTFSTLSYSGGQGYGSWFLLRPANVAHGHAVGTRI